MKTRKKELGKRLVVWIPEKEFWCFRVISRIRRQAEENGIPLSQGDVVRLALEEYLRKHAILEDFGDEI